MSTHPLVPGIKKKSLLGAAWVFLTRGKWDVEALVQIEVMTHQEGEAVLQKVMQMRGRRNERQHNNQTARQKAVAHQAVAAQQEATQKPTGQMEGNSVSRGANTSRGREAV